MKKLQIPSNMSRKINNVGLKLKKHSPEILVAAGIAGAVTSAVMACKATLKVNEVVEEAKDNVERIHVATERGYTDAGEVYDVEDSKKDLTLVYVQTGVKLVKLYAPAVALGTLSIVGIVKSTDILRKRNFALAAAYATVDKGFKEYRSRVVERFGADLDRELRYNIKAREIEEVVTNEDGTEQTVKKTVDVAEPTKNEYTRCFDETCFAWDRIPEFNLKFLMDAQNHLNDRLRLKGHVFLNEVYDLLGFPRTKVGQVVGWVYDETNPDCDCYIDFGIHDLTDERKRAFVNGHEPSVWLDFNVDGVIWDLIQ